MHALDILLQQATISKFNKLKLTNSNSSILIKLDELGEDHDADPITARDQISEENTKLMKVKERISTIKENLGMAVITSPELLAATLEEHESRKFFHPGFVISFDNLDFQLKRRNMTKDNQNQDYHWGNHQMVENRFSGNSLDVRKTDPEDIVNIPNTRFLPNLHDQQNQHLDYIILTSREF